MTIRVAVLQADGSWLGSTKEDGTPTQYGQPMYWWDGAAWQHVVDYDDVYVWSGVNWVPWSDNRYAVVGTAWKGNVASTSVQESHTFAYPAGQPLVVSVGYDAGSSATPADTVYPELSPPVSPTFVTETGAYGNGGTGYACSAGWTEPGVTQPVNHLSLHTTLSPSQDPVPGVTGWLFPQRPGDAFDVGAAYIVVPLGMVGVGRVFRYITNNCRVTSGSDNQRYFPGWDGATSSPGLLVRACAVWDQGATTVGVPGAVPTPTGYTQLYQGTQACSGAAATAGFGSVRLAVFFKSVAPNEVVADLPFTLASSSSNGESAQSTIMLV